MLTLNNEGKNKFSTFFSIILILVDNYFHYLEQIVEIQYISITYLSNISK